MTHRVQLLAHGFFTFGLAGHDKGAADVAVLNEPFAIIHAQLPGGFQSDRAAGVRNRYDRINLHIGHLLTDLLSQFFAHVQARVIHVDAVNDAVRTTEVNEFEQARRQLRAFAAQSRMQLPTLIDHHRFARMQITNQLEACGGQSHRFAGHHVLNLAIAFALTKHQGPNPIGVAERQHAMTADQGNHCIGALATAMHLGHGVKEIVRRGLKLAQNL